MIEQKRYYNTHKKYVEVIALHTLPKGDERKPPKPIRFRGNNEDGTATVYHIDNILSVDRMAARKAGGMGYRYVVDTTYDFEGVEVPGHFLLYYEDALGDWFIEVN